MLGRMPMIVRVGSFRVHIYLDDHPPPHVHVIHHGTTFRIRLERERAVVEEVKGRPKRSEVKRAEQIVRAHFTECWVAWTRYHHREDGRF